MTGPPLPSPPKSSRTPRRPAEPARFLSAAIGKPVVGVDAAHQQVDFALVDFLFQVGEFGLAHVFGDIDVPSLWPAVAVAVPAIAAGLQGVLQIEGAVLRPDP